MGRDDARNGGNGDPAASAGAGVDAGVEELNEMTIGRTDDPKNPPDSPAFEAATLFGIGSRTPSGPADIVPRQQAGHMIAIEPPVKVLFEALASEGPPTHQPEPDLDAKTPLRGSLLQANSQSPRR
jgi:hypothetical protein